MKKPHIYKITNNVNGKYYYGVHDGSNTDNYTGSGTTLKKAYTKYGMSNFSKEILLWFDTIDEAYEYERVIVNEKTVANRDCYNQKIGGVGGSAKGRKCSKETKSKISAARKKIGNSKEHAKRISEGMKGGKRVFKEVTCPHCNKNGKNNVMHRWHFDNCKSKQD